MNSRSYEAHLRNPLQHAATRCNMPMPEFAALRSWADVLIVIAMSERAPFGAVTPKPAKSAGSLGLLSQWAGAD